MNKSPLQIIKDGIINTNWNEVIVGYEQLTGEKINKNVKKHKYSKNKKPTKTVSLNLQDGVVILDQSDYNDPRVVSLKPELQNLDLSFEKDVEIDQKIKKSRGNRRGKITYTKITCSGCKKQVDIENNKIGAFNINNDVDSIKPNYFCSNCS